jgi:uncharacterized protein YbaR (Trm112 family)
MNKKLLDILVCPFDKVSSLDLVEFKSASSPQQLVDTVNKYQTKKVESPSPDSGLVDNGGSNSKENKKTSVGTESGGIVEEGLLLCKTCFRFYPIIEEIPIILPDDLRDKKKDIEFLKKWKESMPQDLRSNLKPWTV